MFGSVNNYWELKSENERLQSDLKSLREWVQRQDEVVELLLDHLDLKVELSKTVLRLKADQKDHK